MIETPKPCPAEPEIGHTVWHRGWECSYNTEAALWGCQGCDALAKAEARHG